jgi:hypothetical protein
MSFGLVWLPQRTKAVVVKRDYIDRPSTAFPGAGRGRDSRRMAPPIASVGRLPHRGKARKLILASHCVATLSLATRVG